MHLADLKHVVSAASARAAAVLDAGQTDAAAQVYTLVFVRLRADLAGLPAPAPGWHQVALSLTDPTNRLPLDALEAQPVHRLQIRAMTLLSWRCRVPESGTARGWGPWPSGVRRNEVMGDTPRVVPRVCGTVPCRGMLSIPRALTARQASPPNGLRHLRQSHRLQSHRVGQGLPKPAVLVT
jgi:hypothetical protein